MSEVTSSSMIPHNQVVEICMPLLQQIMQLKQKPTSFDEALHQQVVDQFKQLEHAAFEQKIAMEKMQYIQYALVAFIDEVALSVPWSGRDTWRSEPLQMKFFGDHIAGENFFKKLFELRQSGKLHADVLELYYVCLQFGFEGAYKMKGLEQLMALQVDIRSQIELARGVIEPKVTPLALLKRQVIDKVTRELPLWVISSVTAVVLCGIYAGYSLVINHHANQALKQINQSEITLQKRLS